MLLILAAGGWSSRSNTQGVSFSLKLSICAHYTAIEMLVLLAITLQNSLCGLWVPLKLLGALSSINSSPFSVQMCLKCFKYVSNRAPLTAAWDV